MSVTSVHKLGRLYAVVTEILIHDATLRRQTALLTLYKLLLCNSCFYNFVLAANWDSVTPLPIAAVEEMPPVTVVRRASA